MSVQSPESSTTPDIRGVSGQSLIEVQFPVSKLSKESYKERKAGASQAITALGKWWGRKPLVLVRAIILGLLLPATDDPEADRETFLALMTMDDDGMLRRLDGSLPVSVVYDLCTPHERAANFSTAGGKPTWRREVSKADRQSVMCRAFLRMGYDRRLEHCRRPEDVDGPRPELWARINAHLDTSASSLPELVAELGQRRFGRIPRVGDVFCGGGSIPFEAARLGCETCGSDLNPVAALLTWGALNIVGGGPKALESVSAAQGRVFDVVQAQVDAWGIERNEEGWVADAYLYCNEVLDPATGWRVPLAPSWVIAAKPPVIARLLPDLQQRRFDIEIVENVDEAELGVAKHEGTWSDGVRCPVNYDGQWLPPARRQTTSFDRLRGSQGLRSWESTDIAPTPGDTFQERLYCIRWIDPKSGKRYYRAPTVADLERERRVEAILLQRFADWQASGFIPRQRIEPGSDINRPTGGRGWRYWHQMFNPRQLLLNGLFAYHAAQEEGLEAAALLLMVGRLADWNSRLCRWAVGSGGKIIGGSIQTFYSPSLPTPMANYSCRSIRSLKSVFFLNFNPIPVIGANTVEVRDARAVEWHADVWLTDPGYADLVSYEQLSEYFLAWYEARLPLLFPGWYGDSRRALAVRGKGQAFRVALSECYKALADRMAVRGVQVVMFTHQDPEVWADLTLILWAAGLQVSAAWTVVTETEAGGIKEGNYVQGTVILVLRKRLGSENGDLADVYPDIQAEVRQQIRSMQALDPKDDPNFGDADYQLAAYAAALRILTSYRSIGNIDVEHELHRTRAKGESSPITALIERAVRIASDELVPAGLDASIWRKLGPEERLYLKGIAVEAQGEGREGVYQELARGYGAAEYRQMLASRTANNVRLKTPSEFAARDMRPPLDGGFTGSLLRYVLFAIYTVAKDPEGGPRAARIYLRQEWPDYWNVRATIIGLLRYLEATPGALPHWATDVKAAQLLLGSVENDTL